MFPKSFEPVSVVMEGTLREGWRDPPMLRTGVPEIPVHAVGLHYGQIAFEGLRARIRAGRAEVFRADLHWERLSRSMSRLSMPPVDRPMFDMALATLLAEIDGQPADDEFLYVRPLVLAVDPDWSMGGAETFRLYLLAGRTREAFDRIHRVVAMVVADRRRTWPDGTGDVKVPANYGPAFAAQRSARRVGAHTVLWLDPQHRGIEEFTSMNAVFVDHLGVLHAPAPGSTVLDGITRRCVVELAKDASIEVDEDPLVWPDPTAHPEGLRGALLATGTAAGLAVIDEVREVSPSGDVLSWRSMLTDGRLSELRELTRACFRDDARPAWWASADDLGRGAAGARP